MANVFERAHGTTNDMLSLIGVNPLAPEMTLTSGDKITRRGRKVLQRWCLLASRRQARMTSGIAAFLIIYELGKRR